MCLSPYPPCRKLRPKEQNRYGSAKTGEPFHRRPATLWDRAAPFFRWTGSPPSREGVGERGWHSLLTCPPLSRVLIGSLSLVHISLSIRRLPPPPPFLPPRRAFVDGSVNTRPAPGGPTTRAARPTPGRQGARHPGLASPFRPRARTFPGKSTPPPYRGQVKRSRYFRALPFATNPSPGGAVPLQKEPPLRHRAPALPPHLIFPRQENPFFPHRRRHAKRC